jgi:hypothetical protein
MRLVSAPKFSIEKPLVISSNADILNTLDGTDEYKWQLKIDEHRSFFIFNGKSLTVLGWRGNVHHTAILDKAMPSMILDGGIIKTKTFKQRPLYYVFDTLMMRGKKVRKTYIERYDTLGTLELPKQFVIPDNTSHIKWEFEALVHKKSRMIERFAEQAGISVALAYEICEGFVGHQTNSLLKYPRNVSYGPSQLKLKLQGR